MRASNRKIKLNHLRWARYQGRCDKAARQSTVVSGYGRACVSWYVAHKRTQRGLGPWKSQRREGL